MGGVWRTAAGHGRADVAEAGVLQVARSGTGAGLGQAVALYDRAAEHAAIVCRIH